MRQGRPWKCTFSPAMRDPAGDHLVVGEGLEHGAVGARDVGRVARERRPAEGPVAAAEERPDVGRHEALEGEGVGVAGRLRLAADVVAVVEDVGAGPLQGDHRLDVDDDARPRRAARTPPGRVARSSSASSRLMPLGT